MKSRTDVPVLSSQTTNMQMLWGEPVFGVSDHFLHKPTESQKIIRCLQVQIYKVEELYFVAKTKADLHLVFVNAKIKITHDVNPF